MWVWKVSNEHFSENWRVFDQVLSIGANNRWRAKCFEICVYITRHWIDSLLVIMSEVLLCYEGASETKDVRDSEFSWRSFGWSWSFNIDWHGNESLAIPCLHQLWVRAISGEKKVSLTTEITGVFEILFVTSTKHQRNSQVSRKVIRRAVIWRVLRCV